MRIEATLLTSAVVLTAFGLGAIAVHDDGDTSPAAPAACAGPNPEHLEQDRQAQWTATVRLVHDDPSIPVWVGFGRVLTSVEVADQLGSTRVEGVMLAFRQVQGTTVNAQERFDPVPADDPAVRTAAQEVLGNAGAMFHPGPGGITADQLAPVSPDVRGGEPPIVGLLISDHLERVVREHPCLIYSLLPGTSGQLAILPTAIGG